jgi:hypothetical protein
MLLGGISVLLFLSGGYQLSWRFLRSRRSGCRFIQVITYQVRLAGWCATCITGLRR